MSADLLELPDVTDEDIQWASRLLKLPDDAFSGSGGDDPRYEVLKTTKTLDVAACPGSGKTTLLVAKLAILSRKWQHRSRGICVLSHTNAARREIETKLGGTSAGQRLLSYPHYIGTIHGFVDDFLAVPWLRSQGFPIKMIDTDFCREWRWMSLPQNIRYGLEQRGCDSSVLSMKSPDGNIGQAPFGTETSTYQAIRNANRRSISAGYFCYDEMLMWAENLLDQVPRIADVIRDRFPILFIDEAQDNSDEQSKILHRIFLDGLSSILRQRFGDNNQAIFDFTGAKGATTDKFPNGDIKDLPNSHRFGQRIADLADPLGIVPHGLRGHGPKQKLLASGRSDGEHTIFLFDANSATKVLDAFAELIIATFSEHELREGTFKAVAQVHRPPDDEADHKFPQHVRHYWPDYDHELTKSDPKPQTFMQHVFAGRGKTAAVRESHNAAEKVAEGILRLAAMAEDSESFHCRSHYHRFVGRLLEKYPDIRERYEQLMVEFVLNTEPPTSEAWNSHWIGIVRQIGEAISGKSLTTPQANKFLVWSDAVGVAGLPTISQAKGSNVYQYGNGKVRIQVGSIHSVKSETHSATLVLESFWYDHNLEKLLPWLDGSKSGGNSIGVRQQDRLKPTYVAMTRPAHLLCLAMKRSSLADDNGNLKDTHLRKLEARGWKITDLSTRRAS